MTFRGRSLSPSLFALLSLALESASAFYIPGLVPTSYKEGDLVPLTVNSLTPSASPKDAQINSVGGIDYYHPQLLFCQPPSGPVDQSESLGSILFGDRIQSSPFELHMLRNESCKSIPGCEPRKYEPESSEFVNRRIHQSYAINWLVDGLPAGEHLVDSVTGQEIYSPGFLLGYESGNNQPVFNNFYRIEIDYHQAGRDQYRVVGVQVTPYSDNSITLANDGSAQCGDRGGEIVLSESVATTVTFAYSVSWIESSTQFATRWDKYLAIDNPQIHWFSLINSAVIVVFLSGMVFVILVRTLKKDITRYNKLDSFVLDDMNGANGHAEADEGVQEDSGWKLVHGDVFRTPRKPLILSIMAGNGAQLFMMVGFTIAFALAGFLSPSNRGAIGSVMVLLYTIFSSVSGFVSSYTYKCLGGEDRWKQNILFTPVALPLVVFSTFFLLDLFLWARGSSGAVPFTTMLVIIGIWFLISIPLSFAGSWLALKRKAVEAPVRTNQIPRQIPDPYYTTSGVSAWLNKPIPAMLVTGILPFGAMFMELYFIMNSLWSAKIYYMFGFLFICYGLTVVTCATVTILSVYFLLCSENYHWQWRAFGTSGSCAVYVFLNALVFWASRISFSTWSGAILYLGYSALISLLVFILTGSIGFFAAWFFVHRIYKSIKVD